MRILLSLLLFISFIFAGVDINKADAKELATLKGIGEVKSKKIVDFRESEGCFESVDDLLKVKGIGVKTLEKNRENITLTECD